MKYMSIIFFLFNYTVTSAEQKIEKWLTLGSTENTIFYYDVNSIENEIPDIFKIEILFNSTTNKKIKSIRSFRTINCKNNTERAIITWYYQKKWVLANLCVQSILELIIRLLLIQQLICLEKNYVNIEFVLLKKKTLFYIITE